MRPPAIHHCTSIPWKFFGRREELKLLDDALAGGDASLIAMVGPGGQGKTAIVQHWLSQLEPAKVDGVFLWSFYRGKDSDLCLRELFAYAEGMSEPPEVSASFCVDRLIPRLREERWAIVLDGAEVVQHESGSWFGRFLHPELGRLLEELASAPMPGVVAMTSRFGLPTLEHRRNARLVSLSLLDAESARGLLRSLGVQGDDADLDTAASAAGRHAKAVELLGIWLTRFHQADARNHQRLPQVEDAEASSEELHVARVLAAFQTTLPQDQQDILALATAFRQPPTEARLLQYLVSSPVETLLHETWKRPYEPFAKRPAGWLAGQVQDLVDLRLLERVGLTISEKAEVLDAHPLVRRGFGETLGAGGQAHARAGFLRGRPDRQPPLTLEQAREEVELFHAYCDAGLWNEADSTFVALDNPKHRFLAPAFERDLLLRFFPEGDWKQPPLWNGFGRKRSLAICFELLGQFEDALSAYTIADAPLRGDALIALGRLEPFAAMPHVSAPWQSLWQAYRAHGLCLTGRNDEALSLARTLVPVDIYEWVHVFECLFRLNRLDLLDLKSLMYQAPFTSEHRWASLARRRMQTDYRACMDPSAELLTDYRQILEAYDQSGLPFERALTRIRFARWLTSRGDHEQAVALLNGARELAQRHGMGLLQKECDELLESGT